MNTNPTQEEKILDFMQARPGEWISMPNLWAISGAFAVHSRVAALRKRGVRIANKVERAPDGTKHSYYQLLTP